MGQNENLSPQLVMFLNDFQKLPYINMPDGYNIRSFIDGDGKEWERIINESFNTTCNFENDIMNSPYFKPERVLFACYGDFPVATATAWYFDDWGKDTGYLHMVGGLASHSGKGLGFWVSLAAIYQMKEDGRTSAVLQTDDFRIPAIKTYLKLGFEPKIIHENQIERWKKIFALIGKPQLSDRL